MMPLPSADTPLYSHALPVLEDWLRSSGFVRSEEDVCRSATLRLIDPPEREIVVEWYSGESVVPDSRLRFKPKDL